MKRPNKYDFDFTEDYESNLETYCDELEAIISKGNCITHYEKKIEVLEKALDKACDELAKQNDGEYWKKSESFDTKEEWKEWLLDEER